MMEKPHARSGRRPQVTLPRLPSSNGLRRERLSVLVATELKSLIRDGKLKPGDRLPTEAELCVHFNVSRITIREAIQMLRALDLVESTRGSGTFVRAPVTATAVDDLRYFAFDTAESLLDLFDVRSLLEEYAVVKAAGWSTAEVDSPRRAALAELNDIVERAFVQLARSKGPKKSDLAKLDRSFHLTIAAISGNLVLGQLLQRVMTLLDLLRPRTLALPGQAMVSWEEHRRIASAINDGDVDLARAELNQHLKSVLKALAPEPVDVQNPS